LHSVKKDRRIIATTIIDRKAAVNQLTWQLRWRLLEGNFNDSRNARVEQRTRFANIQSMSKPKQFRMNLVHP
jgi:hypothetical protein